MLSLLLLGLSTTPIMIYGLISLSKGYYFLPNSVLIKFIENIVITSEFSLKKLFISLLTYGVTNIIYNPHICVLIFVTLFLLFFHFRCKIYKISTVMMLIIYILTTCLHILFASTGWFFRYEAYLVTVGIVVISIGLIELPIEKYANNLKKGVFIIFLLLLLLPLEIRGIYSLLITPQATTNIYQQQYQMGLFLKQFYEGESIAANDIGAINFLADIKCLDLVGLGSLEVAKAKINGNYKTQLIYNLTQQKNVKIAIVYKHWFEKFGGLPSSWIEVGEWKISNNIVCGGETVTFYAVDPTEENKLIENLRNFSSKLPRDVKQSGKYIQRN